MRIWDIKRAAAGLACAALCLALSGCAAVFDRSYSVSQPYEASAGQEEPVGTATDSITSYAALRRAIMALVSEHTESAQLQFANYDGDLHQDISTACWEVKSSTPLGAFAVDYISYDLSRIVSYYQAEVNIAYKRSAAQVGALENALSSSVLSQRLDSALRRGDTYLALQIADGSATADTIRADVAKAYYADPLACPVLPEVEVGLYPETGVSRIAEVSLNYALEPGQLAQRRQELAAAVDVLAAQERDDVPEGRESAGPLYAMYAYLAENCLPDAQAGSTAWDALTAGTADSEGIALALKAGCDRLGVECLVVSGRLDGEDHFWNIVTLDGASYHVDASGGEPEVFLAGDGQLWGLYWWDTSQYPACPSDYYFFGGPEPSPEPEEIPEQEDTQEPEDVPGSEDVQEPEN